MNAKDLPGRADELSEISDLAEEVLEVLGAGRGARVDPDALTSLAAAALALGATRGAVYRASGDAARSDTELLDAAEEAEYSVMYRYADAQALAEKARDELTQARHAEDRARGDLARARGMPVSSPCDGCHDARDDAIAAAHKTVDAALADQGYCDDALETLDGLTSALALALICLRRVASDLENVYEVVYSWLQPGRVLPRDTDFVSGDDDLSLLRRTAGLRTRLSALGHASTGG